MSEKKPLAVVTMAYNEKYFLPIWLKHYDRQIGLDHCYIIDHGSNDGSTDNTGANIIRLPRTPMDEAARSSTVANFCSSLFIGYKRVLFTDADELVVADPHIAPSLNIYVNNSELPQVINMFGVDVLHTVEEQDIDLMRPISNQRHFARPISTLCKPTLIASRTDWMHGFHCIFGDHYPTFKDLYLFHIAHCDYGILYERQKKRNSAAPVGLQTHHTIPPDALVNHMKTEVAMLPRRNIEMKRGEKHFEKTKLNFSQVIAKKEWCVEPDLWHIPPRFVGTF